VAVKVFMKKLSPPRAFRLSDPTMPPLALVSMSIPSL